uniref:Secreted protein n=1 Tax=Plectus sambesii TaxID=2011161 RepID=A0A914VST2_9BILA
MMMLLLLRSVGSAWWLCSREVATLSVDSVPKRSTAAGKFRERSETNRQAVVDGEDGAITGRGLGRSVTHDRCGAAEWSGATLESKCKANRAVGADWSRYGGRDVASTDTGLHCIDENTAQSESDRDGAAANQVAFVVGGFGGRGLGFTVRTRRGKTGQLPTTMGADDAQDHSKSAHINPLVK